MRTITLEEHFISPGFLAGPGKDFTERLRNSGPRGAKVYQQLQDIGDKRIADMDAAGIDMQVLSLNSPGWSRPRRPSRSRSPASPTIFSPRR